MSKSYYVYNNEAIASLVLEQFLKSLREIDIARFLLILPIVFDDRIIKKIKTNDFIKLEDLINKYPTLFTNFNDRYLDLIPISINSLTLLKEMDVVVIVYNKIFYNSNTINYSKNITSDRLDSISEQIQNVVNLIADYETSTLYKILKIRL